MTAARPQPTPLEHPVGLDELFFSTTDRRGMIRSGNRVFVEISGYPVDDLIGAPHNIIRHPDMPAGAFELMWSRLLTGRPMGAYVQNMAADGGTYWVFATITPLGDGFLSVRSAPASHLFPVVRDLYRTARAEEERYAATGHHRGDVARFGVEVLARAVAALGYESYEAFMFEALVAETSARRAQLGPQAWQRPGATGPAADLLVTVGAIDGALAELGGRLHRYDALADRLTPAAAHLLTSATALEHAADHAVDASDATGKKVLSNTARVMRTPMHEAVVSLNQLAPRLHHVVTIAREVGFLIALAQLHAEMIVRFAIEVLDGVAPESSLGDVGALCDVLHEDVVGMVDGIDGLTRDLRDVSEHIDVAAGDYDTFGHFLAEWGRLAVRALAGSPMGDVIRPIEAGLADGRAQLRALRELSSECRTASMPIDVAAFDAALARMQRAAGAYAPGALPPPAPPA